MLNEFITMIFPKKHLTRLKDLIPTLLLSIFMSAIVYSINFIYITNWLTLIVQICLGIVIYLGGARIFKMESLSYCISIIKNLLERKKKEKTSNE